MVTSIVLLLCASHTLANLADQFTIVAADESNVRQLRTTQREVQTRPSCTALAALAHRSRKTEEAAHLLKKLCDAHLSTQRHFSNGCLYLSESSSLRTFLESNHSADLDSLGGMFENAFFPGTRCPTTQAANLHVTSAGGHSFTTCKDGFQGETGECVHATFVGEQMTHALKIYSVDGNMGIPRAWYAMQSGRPWRDNPGDKKRRLRMDVEWVLCEDGTLEDPEVKIGDVNRQMDYLNDMFRDSRITFNKALVRRIQNPWCERKFCKHRAEMDGNPLLVQLAPRMHDMTVLVCDLDDTDYVPVIKRLETNWIVLNSRVIKQMRGTTAKRNKIINDETGEQEATAELVNDKIGQTADERWGPQVYRSPHRYFVEMENAMGRKEVTLARAVASTLSLVPIYQHGCDQLGDFVFDTPSMTRKPLFEDHWKKFDANNQILSHFMRCQPKFKAKNPGHEKPWIIGNMILEEDDGKPQEFCKEVTATDKFAAIVNVMNDFPRRCLWKYIGSGRKQTWEKGDFDKAQKAAGPFTAGQVERMWTSLIHDYPSIYEKAT